VVFQVGGKTSTLDVQLFERAPLSMRRAIEAEPTLGQFLGVRCETPLTT
jgi:hypothetical protein